MGEIAKRPFVSLFLLHCRCSFCPGCCWFRSRNPLFASAHS